MNTAMEDSYMTVVFRYLYHDRISDLLFQYPIDLSILGRIEVPPGVRYAPIIHKLMGWVSVNTAFKSPQLSWPLGTKIRPIQLIEVLP